MGRKASVVPDVTIPNKKLLEARAGLPNRQGGYIANPLTALASKPVKNQSESLVPTIPRIDAEMKSNIVAILDDYTLKGGKNMSLQQDAAKIAEDLGLKMPKRYGDLVSMLGKVLDKSETSRPVNVATAK